MQMKVSHDVEKAIIGAVSQDEEQARATSTKRIFNPNEREARLEMLKKAIAEKQGQLSRDVTEKLTKNASASHLEDIGPVLKSSLADIELMVKNETGTTVDLSPTARVVQDSVTEQAAEFSAAREAFRARDGLDLYTDSDYDGISNFDEVHIYHTDPHNAYSGGGSLTDGERVLLGFELNSTSTRRVAVESPVASGGETRDIFEVQEITVHSALPQGAATPERGGTISFAGRALPNSFVTLYIFSTPIVVTVKSDSSGSWRYTLDSEMPNGNHQLYVATVDAGGKILAKSPVIPFIKTAEAAAFTPLSIAETPTNDPLDVLRNNMLLISLFGIGVFGLVALGILGVRRKEHIVLTPEA